MGVEVGQVQSRPARRRTALWAMGAFVLALALVVGIGVFVRGASGDPSAGPSTAVPSASKDPTEEPSGMPSATQTSTPEPVEESLPAFPSPSTTAQAITPSPTQASVPTQESAVQQEPGVQEALSMTEEQAARILLDNEEEAVDSLIAGRWYPFLSSKCAGLGAFDPLEAPVDMGPAGRIGMPDGVGEGYSFLGSNRILALQRYYQSRFGPDVVNATTQSLGRRTTYEGICGSYPMWITIDAGVSFSKPSDALAWCRENGFIAFECGAFPAFMPDKSLKRLEE